MNVYTQRYSYIGCCTAGCNDKPHVHACVLCRLHGVFDLGMMNACEVTDADSTSHLQIMDGQQRMVTICLIYAAIRRILLDNGGTDELRFAKGSVI